MTRDTKESDSPMRCNRFSPLAQVFMATIFLVAATRSTGYAQAGSSGFPLLKLGISGQGIAMGDAMSAYAAGAAATFYNPAGLANPVDGAKPSQLILMHKEWIQDTRTEFLAASAWLGEDDAIGVSLNSTTVSDIEIRTRPGEPEGTFTARNFVVGVSYARSFQSDVQLGLTGKFLYEKILIDEASGFAVDFGLRYSTPVERLSLGLAVSNIGQMSILRDEKTKLPALLRVGPAYTLPIEEITSNITLASDLLYVFPEKKSYLNVGGEILLRNLVAARAGYQSGSQGRGFSAGLGIHYGIVSLDYAYTALSADLGNTNTFSLTINL